MYVFTSQQSCLLNLSANIWRRRGAAKRFGLSFNEETATEVLLLDIAEQFPGTVTIIPFSHSREAQIGADWAWGFVGPDGCSFQGMLVQAKRLDDKDSEYRELSYLGGQKGSGQSQSQIDRLIESGKHFGLPPIYRVLQSPEQYHPRSGGLLRVAGHDSSIDAGELGRHHCVSHCGA